MQLFLGLFSKDDSHSWTGAHDLKVAGQCQGGLQLFLDLFSKDDIHIWTGAHDLEMAGQFRGWHAAVLATFRGFAAVPRSLFKR